MDFDIEGRINNMNLPNDKQALLYSTYEAVSNSIHAIEDKYGDHESAKLGRIDVTLFLDNDNNIN